MSPWGRHIRVPALMPVFFCLEFTFTYISGDKTYKVGIITYLVGGYFTSRTFTNEGLYQ